MHGGLINVEGFLGALLLLIVAAKIGAEIAERLGQPSVLGEIIAGILVGATGLGLVVRGFDPTSNAQFFHIFGLTGIEAQGTYQALDVLAEIGAIILLFEIGLHTDLYELRKVGKSALWVGFAGVVLPFIGGWAVSKYLLHLQGLTPLIMGAALTATSVGITARVFQDLKLLHTAESQVVLGAAVADDVIGLVILAIISAVGASQIGGSSENLVVLGLRVTFLAVAFLVLAVWLGVKAVPTLETMIGRMRSRGALTVMALVFCLAIALLGTQVKLALIIGAFAAGLVLSHCECQKEIQEGIKPLADIFIPLFFAMLGTVVNLRVMLHDSSVVWATIVLVVVAVIGKVLGCMTVPDKNLNKLVVGLAMIPRGEVGLIYARLGIQNNWLPPADYNALVLMVVLTTVMTPPLLRMAAAKMQRTSGEGFPHPERTSIEREDGEIFDVHDLLQEPKGDATAQAVES